MRLPLRRKTRQRESVLLAPEHDSSLAASDSAGKKTASRIFLRSYGQRTGKNRLQTTDSRRVVGQAPTKTASGRSNASEYDPQVEFLEIGVAVNGVKAWKVYGPDINGTYGGMQGTGGLEATIMDGTGTTTGVLNDYFGNDVATISGGAVTWNTTNVGGYGPLPDSAATPLTDATQLAQSLVWRGHRIDPTGFYYLGARYYEPTSGRFLSPDPKGQAASMSLYDFVGGDPINFVDPTGLAPVPNFGPKGDRLLGQAVINAVPSGAFVYVDASTQPGGTGGPGTGTVMLSGNFNSDGTVNNSVLATTKTVGGVDVGAQWTGQPLVDPSAGTINPAIQAGTTYAGAFATDQEISIYGGVPVGNYFSFGFGLSWDNPYQQQIDNAGNNLLKPLTKTPCSN
jgi:RHS repeat-associated protein